MNEHASLFAETDQAALLQRSGGAHVREADLQIEWRSIQLAHMPDLSREESAELFSLWLEHELTKLTAARDAALGAVQTAINESARRNGPPASPLRCPCGAVLRDPGDLATLREHGPHFQAMGELRRLARRE